MYEFEIRAAQADRQGRHPTVWGQAIPIRIVARTKVDAFAKARDLLGRPKLGRYWQYQVDATKEVVDV